MDFTREPIIETVITPKEGCKLVVRSSKSAGQEEYFVDAVEVVSFGNALFFRSIERPKAFLAPASDYEVLEVREARMVLKNVGIDRTIKIGGGREVREPAEKRPREQAQEPVAVSSESSAQVSQEGGESLDPKTGRLDKRRDKRRHNRRRRGRDEGASTEEGQQDDKDIGDKEEAVLAGAPSTNAPAERSERAERNGNGSYNAGNGNGNSNTNAQPFSALLPPPPTLISETIARYRDNAMFKDAFFVKEDEAGDHDPLDPLALPLEDNLDTGDHSEDMLEAIEMQNVTLEPSAYGSFSNSDEDHNEGNFNIDTLDAPVTPKDDHSNESNERSDYPK